jgi:hypothetical protein
MVALADLSLFDLMGDVPLADLDEPDKPVAAELPASGAVRDPRPDLADDSRTWAQLLTWAHLESGGAPDGAYGAMHGVRCCGARLILEGAKPRLVPGNAYAGDWAADRERWLLPHRVPIARWLGLLVAGEAAPRPLPRSGYRYATYFGFWCQSDGKAWVVHAPDGTPLARAREWRKALWHALDLRPDGEYRPAKQEKQPAKQHSDQGEWPRATVPDFGPDDIPPLEPDGLPAVGDDPATAAWLAGLGTAD